MRLVPICLSLLLATPVAAQEFWTRELPGIAPSLRACLGTDAKAAVVAAVPLEGGRLLARIRGADGERVDCTALGDRVTGRRPVGIAPPMVGEDERRFTLERGCVDARRVDAADGTVLGWIGYPGCG